MKINCFWGVFFLLIGFNATAQTTKTLYTPTCAYSTQPAYTTTTIASNFISWTPMPDNFNHNYLHIYFIVLGSGLEPEFTD